MYVYTIYIYILCVYIYILCIYIYIMYIYIYIFFSYLYIVELIFLPIMLPFFSDFNGSEKRTSNLRPRDFTLVQVGRRNGGFIVEKQQDYNDLKGIIPKWFYLPRLI